MGSALLVSSVEGSPVPDHVSTALMTGKPKASTANAADSPASDDARASSVMDVRKYLVAFSTAPSNCNSRDSDG